MKRASRVLAMLSACSVLQVPSLAQSPASVQPNGRMFAKGAWVEVARVSDDGGRLLTNPIMLAAHGDTAFVYDAGTQDVVALQKRGNVLWRVGRAGKGPREFSNPVDVQFAPNGTLHVLDSDVSRITILDQRGRVIDMRRIAEPFHRIVPRRSGWWAVSLGRSELLVAVDSNGRSVAGRAVAAPADIAGRHMLVREPFVAPTPNGGAVVAFVWSSRLIVIGADGNIVADLEGPERVPFAAVRSYAIETPQKATVQRIDPKAHGGAVQLAANDSMALVVFGGSSKNRGRLVDRFDLRTRRYVDSALLPRQPAAIRIVGNTLVALERDPAPALVWYEWRRDSARQ